MKGKLSFSRKINGIFKKNVWKEGISFYSDRVGYQHKYNPFGEGLYQIISVQSMTWPQRSEGLDSLCTAKGSHTGSSGRMTHFFVAISFHKGIISSEQYFGKISGEMFGDFIHTHFIQSNEQTLSSGW